MDAGFALSCTDEQFEKYMAALKRGREQGYEQEMVRLELQRLTELIELKAQQQPSRLRQYHTNAKNQKPRNSS